MNTKETCWICGDDPDETVICTKCRTENERWEKHQASYIERGWIQETCGNCRGYGVVSWYSAHDFEGARDCEHCIGGTVWRTPRGKHHALWPGGPFVD